MQNKYIILMIILLAVISGCKSPDNQQENGRYEQFTEMQEQLIDSEELVRQYIIDNELKIEEVEQENTELRKQSDQLYTQLRELKKTIPAKPYIQEIKGPEELPNPTDRIKDEQLVVSRQKVVLNIKNSQWWYLTESNSMDPLLDKGTTVLTVKPTDESDISEGDIIIFESKRSEGNTVHRVIEISRDESGTYYTTKGDNNPYPDADKIMFEEVLAIVVGILY